MKYERTYDVSFSGTIPNYGLLKKITIGPFYVSSLRILAMTNSFVEVVFEKTFEEPENNNHPLYYEIDTGFLDTGFIQPLKLQIVGETFNHVTATFYDLTLPEIESHRKKNFAPSDKFEDYTQGELNLLIRTRDGLVTRKKME